MGKKSIVELVEAFKRKMLAKRLSWCTKAQQEFFHKLYPKGVPEDKLISAIDLCERTIKKNIEDKSRLDK
jgi:hypothetical protein